MSTLTNEGFGQLNGSAIGIIMKEAARRAIKRIQVRRMGFSEFAKESINPNKDTDLFTDADIEAQEIYLHTLHECTPEFGILGEEGNLVVECRHPTHDIYWTVDPLDGTRAFTRKQSHGVGTMISLVCDGVIIAALVGDVMTSELFYFRPDSPKVHRIYEFSSPEELAINPKKKLQDQYLLLRDPPEKYSLEAQQLAVLGEEGLFKSYQIADGSIGTMMARLWKGEVGAAALLAGSETPWDMTPIVGISQKLGFIFLEKHHGGWYGPIDIVPQKSVLESVPERLIIHESRLAEFSMWGQ